jgi:hypothetical protein
VSLIWQIRERRHPLIIYQYVRPDGAVIAEWVEGVHISFPPGRWPTGDYGLACKVQRDGDDE